VGRFKLDVLLLEFLQDQEAALDDSDGVGLLSLLLHLHEFVLVVQQFEVLVEEAFSLHGELVLNLHVHGLDLHLQVADNWVLVQLIVESVAD
jgi:hypothetical protein